MDHQPFEVDKISNPDTLHYVKFLPKFTPVIHIKSESHAVEQAQVAFENGADGIFLIEHARSHRHLKRAYDAVRQKFSTEWIGLNMLDLSSLDAVANVPQGADGLWLDDGGFYVDVEGTLLANIYRANAEICGLSPRCSHPWTMFSGFEFKYQKPAINLEEAANWAIRYTDVPTTSGNGTGQAADISKIVTIKSLLGDKPLAIASGITPENVDQFLPYVDCFMVSTGISKSFHDLDPVKTYQLATLINA
jgi:hypothetical protein